MPQVFAKRITCIGASDVKRFGDLNPAQQFVWRDEPYKLHMKLSDHTCTLLPLVDDSDAVVKEADPDRPCEPVYGETIVRWRPLGDPDMWKTAAGYQCGARM